MAAQDPQSRRWSLTINNPKDCGLDHDTIIERLHLFHPRYFCLADEIGESGTYHTHIYLFSHSPIRFSTIKNRFPPAHIEKSMKGSVANRDYITKSGKWADTKKVETSVEGTFFEFGDIPTEAEEDSPSMYALMGCVEQGMTNAEIIRQKPSYAFRLKGIDEMRVWGDRIFEKCGIRRDEGGDGGKTLEIRGKRRLSARDGGANYQQS